MSLSREEIAALKKEILPAGNYDNFAEAFGRLEVAMGREFKVIEEHGNRVIPEVQFSELRDGTLPEYIEVSLGMEEGQNTRFLVVLKLRLRFVTDEACAVNYGRLENGSDLIFCRKKKTN